MKGSLGTYFSVAYELAERDVDQVLRRADIVWKVVVQGGEDPVEGGRVVRAVLALDQVVDDPAQRVWQRGELSLRHAPDTALFHVPCADATKYIL